MTQRLLPRKANMVGQDGEYRCAYCDSRHCTRGCAVGYESQGWCYIKFVGWVYESDLTDENRMYAACESCGGRASLHIGDCPEALLCWWHGQTICQPAVSSITPVVSEVEGALPVCRKHHDAALNGGEWRDAADAV